MAGFSLFKRSGLTGFSDLIGLPKSKALVRVDNTEAAKRFFKEYRISYKVIQDGKNAGSLMVKPIRETDKSEYDCIVEVLRNAGFGDYCVRSRIFRNSNDEVIVTFSPDDIPAEWVMESGEVYRELDPCWVQVSNYSIQGHGTRTVVVGMGCGEPE